jgi:hypothetical protein
MDDILIFSQTQQEYLARLRQVFERFRKHKLTANPKKCLFGLDTVEFVPFICYLASNMEAIELFRSHNIFQVWSLKHFLQLTGFMVEQHYRRYSARLLSLRW